MEPLFKVGDLVRIRNLHELEYEARKTLPFSATADMCSFVGKVVRITEVKTHEYDIGNYPEYPHCDGCQYYISEDDHHWSWSSPMFERVTSEIGSKLKLAKKHNIRLNFKN